MTKISVENIGPIVAGEVELKPLTIFIGPSNTGKSYLATAIYALMKAFENRYKIAFTFQFGPSAEADTADKEKRTPFLSFPKEVRSSLEDDLHKAIQTLRDNALFTIRSSYGPGSEFVRRGSRTTHFFLRIHQAEPRFQMDLRLEDCEASPVEFDISSLSVFPPMLEVLDLPDSAEIQKAGIYNHLLSSALNLVFSESPSRTHYLPAARSGMTQGYKVLAAALVRQSSSIGPRRVSIPALPAITTEFLSDLISISPRMAHRAPGANLMQSIDFIENEVLRGRIELDESTGLPYSEIVYEPVSAEPSLGKFTLDRTSSMVSELAPVILFLKHLVEPGDLLILEEPESHLHPAAQRQMARGIVRLVNAGVKVLITTHSDYMLSQINNLMRLNYASRQTVKKYGYESEDCLGQADVSAYAFRWKDELGGSIVHELSIRPDTGIDEDDFAAVASDLYDETVSFQRISVK